MSARTMIDAAKELIDDLDEDDFDLDSTLFKLRQVRMMMDPYLALTARFRRTFTMLTVGGLILMLTGFTVIFGIEHGLLSRPSNGPDSTSILMTTFGMGALAFGFFKRLEFAALGSQLEAQRASLDLAIKEGVRLQTKAAGIAQPAVAEVSADR